MPPYIFVTIVVAQTIPHSPGKPINFISGDNQSPRTEIQLKYSATLTNMDMGIMILYRPKVDFIVPLKNVFISFIWKILKSAKIEKNC